MRELLEWVLRNRRIQSALLLAVLGVLGFDTSAPDVQRQAAAILPLVGMVGLVVDYFVRVGPRGLLRVASGLLGSMPVLYNVIREAGVQAGAPVADADAAVIAEGVTALYALLAPMLSAARPNAGTEAKSGRLRNRNP